ncbi:MAG: hypothetical protein RL189_2216 [Pseudomonadota bacterium]|jgi:predicted nucleotidyltransferase
MKFGLRDSDLAEINSILERFPEIDSAKIFGSRAMGTHRPGSDVDIALFGAGVDLDTVAKVHDLLEEQSRMPYLFDVVDFTHLKHQPLRDHIDRVGIVIYFRATKNSPA